jgi:hypothetical protein
VLNYHRLGSQTSGKPGDYEMINEDIPASSVLHATINKLSYEMRGRPELFSVLPWLKAYKDWLENRARQNHWRGSLLWDVTLEGATASNVAAKRAQYKQPPPPGSLTIHNEKEKWTPLESKANAPDVAEDGKQIKVMAAVGVKLPLYMLSEGEDANKATATAQQLPALKKFEDFQDILVGQVWKPVYRRVLQNAIDSGILPEEVEEQDADGDPILDDDGQPRMVKSLEAFDVSAPQLSETDRRSSDALGIAVSNEWISDETATTEFGYDYRLSARRSSARGRFGKRRPCRARRSGVATAASPDSLNLRAARNWRRRAGGPGGERRDEAIELPPGQLLALRRIRPAEAERKQRAARIGSQPGHRRTTDVLRVIRDYTITAREARYRRS